MRGIPGLFIGIVGLIVLSLGLVYVAGVHKTNLIAPLGIAACWAFMMVIQSLIGLISTLGIPKPDRNKTPISREQLIKDLLALNNPDSPFEVTQKEDTIVCSWKVAEAKWFEFFAKVNLFQDYKLFLKPVSGNKVRAIEETRTFKNAIGQKSSVSFGYSRGWSPFRYQKETAMGIKSLFPLTVGKIYDINFSPNVFRGPILNLITDSGWAIQPCTLSLDLGI